jgi:ribonuclease HI
VNYDLILAGDGAGSTASSPCGWAVFSWDTKTDTKKCHFGGASEGTNNYAELTPYLHALWVYHGASPRGKTRVLIVSDSEVTVECGNGEYERRANGSLWAAYDWFVRNGYEVTWRWRSRDDNKKADNVAGLARKLMEDFRGNDACQP